MQVPNIKNRLDLREVLESYLRTDKEEKDKYSLKEEKTDLKPKSYIIESNLGEKLQLSDNNTFKSEIKNTEDKSLKNLFFYNGGDYPVNLYLDVSDKRFWIIHSLYSARLTNKIIKSFILINNSKLDFPWLASNNIEKISKIGKETGFSLKYHDYFMEDDDNDYDEKLKKISMRFWGGRAKNIIDHLREEKDLKKGISLSSIDLKYVSEIGYVKTNISNIGKFVVIKGDTIDNYFTLINKIKHGYSEILSNIESNYRITYKKSDTGFKLNGNYCVIEFSNEIENIDEFSDKLTSCNHPFRLWGVRKKLEDNYIRINGIDLHTCDKVNFELTPNWMRVYLPGDSCGNVITRLFTNLQNYYDSDVKIIGSEHEELI